SPVECRPFTNVPSRSIRARAGAPMRVMMRMLATTYGLSVISTPQRDSGESIGPMQYGITYIVRPCMQPSNSASILAWARAGVVALRGADEGQVLDPRHVIRVGAVQPAARVGLVVEADQRAVGLHAGDQGRVFGVAAVAPVDRVGAGQRRHLRHPGVERGEGTAGGAGRENVGDCIHGLDLRRWILGNARRRR